MRVMLSAEGKRDIGGLADPVYGDPADEGFFQPLVRRALGVDVEFLGDRSLAFGVKPPKSVNKKLVARAHRAVVFADAEECDIVVLHTDADARMVKSKPPANWNHRRKLLSAGVAAAGNDRPWAILAVPIATTEAWALADADCVRRRGVDDPALAKSPETLWGAPHDPSSNHPKCVLERVLGGAAGAATQAELAEAMDLPTAKRRCPRSLAPFLAALEAA